MDESDIFTCPVCGSVVPIDDLEYDDSAEMVRCDVCDTWVLA